MTDKDSIRILHNIFDWMKGDERWTDAEFIALKHGIDAIEMRVPMPVRVTTSTKRCGRCGRQLSGIGNIHPTRNFCAGCGQAIDWSDKRWT